MSALAAGCGETNRLPEWPVVTNEAKPWTRWWWMGSAVNPEGITSELESMKRTGIGGVEITPIYGVAGYEDQFVNFLSPGWVSLLEHTLKEAERLGLGVDMATGTGWPFGGPWIGAQDACMNMNHKVYVLSAGESLREPIRYHQEPYVRSVGTQLYELHGIYKKQGERNVGTLKEPAVHSSPSPLTVDQLVEPVEANPNLQALALDQVKYDKWLKPEVVMAYSDQGKVQQLTHLVDADGRLQWTAPEGTWTLYAIFPGWHGKMVERAAPGGEGNVIDHFSQTTLLKYLHTFDTALARADLHHLRSYFNDSYEVDDARGAADWTPDLFEQFRQRRGYDLQEHLPDLLSGDSTGEAPRILCDYRETISELVRDRFTKMWARWAHDQGRLVRNQAHGSPSNILDLYAEVDIPEIEGTDPLRIKMATSAGNVSGKKLVSSESATWLNEHFQSNLSDIKGAIDRFLLNGVNHVVYHGTCYSPDDEPWPGWLFYAAVHMNDRNPMWEDAAVLNEYIARSQSLLQTSKPDNEVLLYYPIYDRFSTPGPEMIEHFDGVDQQFEGTAFKKAAALMLERGYTFDYISDHQIQSLQAESGKLVTSGQSAYKVLVIPHCLYMPQPTIEAILALIKQGAQVVFYEGLPSSYAGHSSAVKRDRWDQGIRELEKLKVPMSTNLEALLSEAEVGRESLVDVGLKFNRKKTESGILYFLVNDTDRPVRGWVQLNGHGTSAGIFDPLTGEKGLGKVHRKDAGDEVFVSLEPNGSVFVLCSRAVLNGQRFQYDVPAQESLPVSGPWMIRFEGVRSDTLRVEELQSWHLLDSGTLADYSGRAAYLISCPSPGAGNWCLDLGTVCETARVTLNGTYIGTTLGPVHRLNIPEGVMKDNNVLEIRVASTMANRIAALDRSGVSWKKFYNVNFPARFPENRTRGLFDASRWSPRPSGLMGPVRWMKL
jgi:hypothetical protein